MLDLCCCAQAFSRCGEWRSLYSCVRGLPTAVASLGVEHGFCVHGLRQLWHTGPQQSGSVVIGAQV